MSLSFIAAQNVQQGDEITASERAKRRHARPLELDSDDEGIGDNDTLQNHDFTSNHVEVSVPVLVDPQIMVNSGKVLVILEKTIKS